MLGLGSFFEKVMLTLLVRYRTYRQRFSVAEYPGRLEHCIVATSIGSPPDAFGIAETPNAILNQRTRWAGKYIIIDSMSSD